MNVVASHRLLARLGLIGLSLLLSLGVVEILLRSYLSDAYYVWQPNTRLEFEAYRHLRGLSGPTKLTTNSFGVRGDPFTSEQRYRLLAVGGSTTICTFLDDSEAWPHVVQDLLNAETGPGSTWVGNVGRPGHWTSHHVLQVEKLLAQHPEIDAVILLVGINDLMRGLEAIRVAGDGPPRFAPARLLGAFSVIPGWDEDSPWYRRSGIGRLLATARAPAAMRRGNRPDLNAGGAQVAGWRRQRQEAPAYMEELPDLAPALESYTSNVRAIIDASEARDVTPIFLTQPTLWRADLPDQEREMLWIDVPALKPTKSRDAYFSVEALARGMHAYNEALLDTCRERNVDCLDAAALLPRNGTVFWDDAHFSVAGARQLAEIIAAYLLEREPLASLRVERSQDG